MNILFNVRAYGILIENGNVLVSDEIHFGREITKFPGGGLQYGEGTVDCVKREFREELELEVEVLQHFYTVDFFQPSAFNPQQQVISIYYLVERKGEFVFPVTAEAFSMIEKTDGSQSFRWIAAGILQPEHFTFPIDRHVSTLIRSMATDHKG